jgi:hypothetical protein
MLGSMNHSNDEMIKRSKFVSSNFHDEDEVSNNVYNNNNGLY